MGRLRGGRGGICTSRKVLPAPGNPGQVLTPVFLSVALNWPKEPHSPSNLPGLGESPGQTLGNSPQDQKVSHTRNGGAICYPWVIEDKTVKIRAHFCIWRNLWAGLRTRLCGRPPLAEGSLWTRASLVALARLTGSLSGFMPMFPYSGLHQCFSIS